MCTRVRLCPCSLGYGLGTTNDQSILQHPKNTKKKEDQCMKFQRYSSEPQKSCIPSRIGACFVHACFVNLWIAGPIKKAQKCGPLCMHAKAHPSARARNFQRKREKIWLHGFDNNTLLAWKSDEAMETCTSCTC